MSLPRATSLTEPAAVPAAGPMSEPAFEPASESASGPVSKGVSPFAARPESAIDDSLSRSSCWDGRSIVPTVSECEVRTALLPALSTGESGLISSTFVTRAVESGGRSLGSCSGEDADAGV